MTIVNYASSGVNKVKASLNDDARVVNYDCHMFIVQATGCFSISLLMTVTVHNVFIARLIKLPVMKHA